MKPTQHPNKPIKHPLADGNPPSWASGWGEDEEGVWVEFSINQISQKMRWIPAGEFLMGSTPEQLGHNDNQGPQHLVSIENGFWLCDTSITQALWEAVMGSNPSRYKNPQHPVEQVSWYDCQKFIDTINQLIPDLNLTLPSEAQWEYACRAGTLTAYSFGDEMSEKQVNYGCEKTWKRELKTVPVKALPSNPWGLYQMHGNVWEWVEDNWHYYYNAPKDGSAWKEADGEAERVRRGGSWRSVTHSCCSAIRLADLPGRYNDSLGFRCARANKSNE